MRLISLSALNMKKTILLLAMLLIGCGSLLKAQDQVLHFYDGFESVTLTYWTTIDADGDGYCWEASSNPEIGGFAYSSSYKRDTDHFLVSPLLDGVTEITFDTYATINDMYHTDEWLSVYFSTTGNELTDFVGNVLFSSIITNSWTEIDVTLPENTKYVAIKHSASYGGGLMVDNVKIWGNESNCIYSIYVDGFTRPYWGAHPDFDVTIPSDAHCTISNVTWNWENSTESGLLSPSDIFNNENLVYYMGIIFHPESGYHFSDYTRVYYNGDPGPFDVIYSSIMSGGEFRGWTNNFTVSPTGVDEQTSEQLIARPNPTSDKLFIEGIDGELVSVYDNTGRLVLQEKYNGHLDVSALAKGVYAVKVAEKTMKFLKD